MSIKTSQFIKGITKADPALESSIPQIAFIGRSNVGKSSVINTLTNNKNLAKTSSFPGRTQEINLFLINDFFYLLDLPGYGYAKTSKTIRTNIQKLIRWYLFESDYEPQLVVQIIDANVGVTSSDLEVLAAMESRGHNILIVANKVDKIKQSEYIKKFKQIQVRIGNHKIIPFSTVKKTGLTELRKEILSLTVSHT